MAIGWFDAFRKDGTPSSFEFDAAPFSIDLILTGILLIFILPSIAFLLISLGIRRFRVLSIFTFLFTMLTGATLLVSIYDPHWQQGEGNIYVNYMAFNNRQVKALICIKVGLKKVNVTLTTSNIIDYNEQFELRPSSSELERALRKGLVYPLLTVAEYLSIDLEGFDWGKQLHFAGYYTAALLWFAFSLWIIQLIFLCILPHKFALMELSIGLVTVLADLCYFFNVPDDLLIRFPNSVGEVTTLTFGLSYCFYGTLIIGLSNILFGTIIYLMQRLNGFSFQTSFTSRFEVTPSLIKTEQRSISMARSLKNLDFYVVNNELVKCKSLARDVNAIFFLPSVDSSHS